MIFETAKNLCPNLQKPPLSSKIHGYTPEMVRLFHLQDNAYRKKEIVSEKIISKDQAVAEVFNKFSINFVPNLKTSPYHGYGNDFIATNDQVTNALNNFRNHYDSIIMIKNKKKMIRVFLLVL